MLNFLKEHYFFLLVTLMILFAVTASFLRFMIIYDYEVRYEGECDPYSQTCFEYCETDECEDPFYYTWITAPAKDINTNCGDDITLCDYAYECVSSGYCQIKYCDPDISQECESLEASDKPDK